MWQPTTIHGIHLTSENVMQTTGGLQTFSGHDKYLGDVHETLDLQEKAKICKKNIPRRGEDVLQIHRTPW